MYQVRIKTPTLESCCEDYMSVSWPQIIITVESEAIFPKTVHPVVL